ncbi:RING-type domain-containing protein [Mycena sanguinolenta]|uniref:RING-type domain-containing protein n=1 Tax=Mycena sanguinolenta TaxID=230812 RepID=A0A8H7CQW7_9AGAR|nr:RING-type domain-containing protein [Mycena sanguinolenta]
MIQQLGGGQVQCGHHHRKAPTIQRLLSTPQPRSPPTRASTFSSPPASTDQAKFERGRECHRSHHLHSRQSAYCPSPPWRGTTRNSPRAASANLHPIQSPSPPSPPPNAAADPAKAGVPDSLFGPNIGPVAPGPAWTSQTQPKRLVEPDELTTDAPSSIYAGPRSDCRRSHPRPIPNPNTTRRKTPPISSNSPLTAPRQSAASTSTRTSPPTHPDAPAHGGALRVFETVVEGGFGRALRPADAAVIELGRFERVPLPASSSPAANSSGSGAGGKEGALAATNGAGMERRRFTPFHFRRRANHSATSTTSTTPAPVAGAALAVVDEHTADNTGGKGDDEDEKGVRITIRLVALDANGRELDSPNEQTVYLVVGRLGAPHPTSSTPAPGATSTTTPAAGEEAATEADITDAANTNTNSSEEGDTRPWVVRVVKREATIGPHTFQLHEIYGLSSAAGAPGPDARRARDDNLSAATKELDSSTGEPEAEGYEDEYQIKEVELSVGGDHIVLSYAAFGTEWDRLKVGPSIAETFGLGASVESLKATCDLIIEVLNTEIPTSSS